MREILFRGFSEDCTKENEIVYDNKRTIGEWVEGSLEIDTTSNEYFIHGVDKNGESFVYDVIPETVGQYIRVKDKNGNKIFEGDIVKAYIISSEIITKEVTYREDLAAFVVGGYPLSKITALRKVGNIYDNPELLEVEK